jgi:hypothetical protein
MPRVSQDILDSIFYLYPTHEQALSGSNAGGCGFFVSVPSRQVKDYLYTFAVTNKHVAAGNYFIRMNKKEGNGRAIGEIIDWEISNNHDIAIVPVNYDYEKLAIKFIPDGLFMKREGINDNSLVIGDDKHSIS